jgi:hypothetical protein
MGKPNRSPKKKSATRAGDLNDQQTQIMVSLGHLEADLLDALVTAARAGDMEGVWAVALKLVMVEDRGHALVQKAKGA